jgi:hypothetical protein
MSGSAARSLLPRSARSAELLKLNSRLRPSTLLV